MTSYVLFAIAALIWLVLLIWRPGSDSMSALVRAYFLVLIGIVVAFITIEWALKRSGLGELTLGDGLLFVVLGAGTAIGAFFRMSPYWEVASVWPLFVIMTDRVRQGVLTVAGLGIMVAGILGVLESRKAYEGCKHDVELALDGAELARVLSHVPNPAIRPYRGAAPYNCEELLEAP